MWNKKQYNNLQGQQQQWDEGDPYNHNYYNENYNNNNYYNNNYFNNNYQRFNQPNSSVSQNRSRHNDSFSSNYNNQTNQSFNYGYNNYPRGNYQNQNNYQGFNTNQNSNKKQQLNASVSYTPQAQYSFNNSFSSEVGLNGMAEVGRFGGKKKKNREELDKSIASNAQSKKSTEPKIKQPTVKQESSNEFYFPTHTETTTYVQCPFNSEHIMEPDRLMTHINRCKLKSPNAKYFQVCPYDPSHYYSKNEIQAHILVCDKRSLFVIEQIDPSTILNTSTATTVIESSENELLEVSSKAPSSKHTNQKKQYEEFIFQDV